MLTNSIFLQYRSQNSFWEGWIEYVFNSPLFWIIITSLLFYLIFTKTKKDYHSHWNTLIDEFDYSTENFYQKFKKELLSHGVSGISTSSVSLHEGSLLSSRRRYVRVSWKDYQYDICAAAIGEGFFISWWLLNKTPVLKILITRIPFLGSWLANKIYPITYYKIDTASMFMTYCQRSVLNVIDNITKDTGVRSLSESDRKPILRDIFKR